MREATGNPSERVLVLGMDMGDGALIREWSRAGALPNFAALIDAGLWLELESTAEVLHTSTWPSFATGSLPGEHGVYYPYQPVPGFQQAQPISPDQYARPTMWALASREGRRCLAYDVPETFPESEFDGRAIFEWGVWAWYGEQRAQPAALIEALKSRFGAYPLQMEAKQLGLKFPDPKLLEKRLLLSVEHKARTLEWLLGEERWDLAVAVFGETHPAGHYLWPKGAVGPNGADDPAFEPVLRVYAAIDKAVGELRRYAPDAALFVLSGDGVRPNNCGWHLLPAVLEKLGYTRPPGESSSGKASLKPASLMGRLKSSLPPGARRFIADHLPWWLRDKIGASIGAARIDWERSRAFALPTDLEGCIRINLKGREPHGIVAPGAEYDALCREIATELAKLKNPATGEPVVRKVWIRNDVFPGKAQEHLPDIMVTWNDAAPISAVTAPSIGTIAEPSPDPRTGTHSTRGFLLAHGARVARRASGAGRLIDVAPTVLGLLGIDAAGAMDGRALELS